MLEQQRIVRTGVLARISAVRYLRSTRLTLEVANRLLDLEDAATDVRISACSTIILSIYSDATQPGPVSPDGGEQAQQHKTASLSSESGESLCHVGCHPTIVGGEAG